MFISFDGIDGAGKTTLVENLLPRLFNKNVRLVKQPKPADFKDTFTNEKRFAESLLGYTADILIQDRGVLTTAAYSLLETSYQPVDISRHLLSLPIVPDKIFYLDYPPELAWRRKQDMYDEQFIKSVYNSYELAMQLVGPFTTIVRIDARKELEEKVQEVLHYIGG